MSESKIEWTERVWNSTTGCNKVSQGCKNCYAEVMHARLGRMGQNKYSRPFLDGAFAHEPSLALPFKWKKPAKIFVNSMSDSYHPNISVEHIAKMYAIMFLTPRHTFQHLTKRPERRLAILKSPEFFEHLHKYCNQYHQEFVEPATAERYSFAEIKKQFPLNNIWEGTSAENQSTADERIPLLLQTPAAIRWVSAEPLLGPIDFATTVAAVAVTETGGRNLPGLDWIVVGGESGNKRRPFDSDWARQIRDYCASTGVKFFMKQVDKVREIPDDLIIRDYPDAMKEACIESPAEEVRNDNPEDHCAPDEFDDAYLDLGGD